MPEERLQKILARAGYGSRRASEQLIAAGRVTLNGKVAHLGSKADESLDHIQVDGQRLKSAHQKVYIAAYKPRGMLSTTGGPDRRPKLTDLVPESAHLHIVGRLDLVSEGLVLLTNDGQLTNRLTHPRYGHEKEYRVLLARQPDEKQLAAWRRGVVLSDAYRTQPAGVHLLGPHGKGAWLRVVMKEGRKRQIRETAEQLGLPVVKLIRVRISSLKLGKMQPGEWRHLDPTEVQSLHAQGKLASGTKRE